MKQVCVWVVAMGCLAGLAWGTDFTWQGGDGLFSDSAKWSPSTGTPSTGGDRALFSTAADGTVTWTGSVTNNEMQVVQTGGNTLVLDLAGYTYALTNRFYFDGTKASSYVVVSNGVLTVPTNTTCEMKINAGVAPARLTFENGAVVNLEKFTSWRSDVCVQTGAVVNINNECKIGDAAANSLNTLNLNGGTLNTNFRLFLPNNGGANCTSLLNIASGKMTAKSYFSIGDKGWGTTWGIVNLSGGELETQGEIWIGNSDGGIGLFNVSGGRWRALNNNLEVGHRTSAVGCVNMSGGEIEVPTASKYFILGNAGGIPACSTGYVSMTGGRITVTNTGCLFLAGYASNGFGRVAMGNDAFINTRSFKLGAARGSVGECAMTGGVVRSIDTVAIGDAAGGLGWMRMEGGALTNLTSAYIGNNGGSTGTLEIAGGTWFTSNTLAVGNNAGATGTVTVTDGSLWTLAASIGNGGNGVLVITNGSFRTGTGDLTDGVNGTGTVVIAGGTLAAGGVFSAGKNRNALGQVAMSGGTLTAANSLRIGDWGGTGSLDLGGGNVMAGTGANSTIGNGNGATGRVTVTGGKLVYSMSVYVGNNGTNTLGTLEVAGGEVVVSNQLVAGNAQYAYGNVAFSGGSVWIGDDVKLGLSSNTCGTLTVSGGSVFVKDYLDVGHAGTGVLNVAGGDIQANVMRCTPYNNTNGPLVEVVVSGGRLYVTNVVYAADAVGSQARFTLQGGTFKLPRLWTSRGSTTLVGDGGELEAIRDEPNFIDANVSSASLTANGLFVDSAGFSVATSKVLPDAPGQQGKLGKRGLGRLTLNAANTFTGPVAVEAGELALGAAGSITLAGGCLIDGGALLNLTNRVQDFTLPPGTVSRIDGELRLASGRTLVVTNGATLSGTGTVARVALLSGATLARAASAGSAVLRVGELVIPAGAVIALSGYSVADLKAGIQIVAGGSLSVASGDSVTVTLEGVPQAPVALRVNDGVLTAQLFSRATLMLLQ